MLSMLNQAAVENLCSATYLEDYLDCLENLPDDLQRVVSQLRELDGRTNDALEEVMHHEEAYKREADGVKKQRALVQIQRGLIKSQEIWDEKLQLAASCIEFVECRSRQLDQDCENLDPCAGDVKDEKIKSNEVKTPKVHSMIPTVAKASPPIVPRSLDLPSAPRASTSSSSSVSAQTTTKASTTGGASNAVLSPPSSSAQVEKNESMHSKVKRQRRQRTHQETITKEEEKKEDEEKQPKKKKKRKAKSTNKSFEKTLVGEPIDPDEPTYCLCEQVSYGDMIGCDNDSCAIEWFHFNCVALTNKPKGKWYCPKCRGDRPNIKRHDLK